jgi:hypothetical protein
MQQYPNNPQIDLVLCECKSLDHQVVLVKFTDEEEVYLEVHLTTHRNFGQRLWYGLKYAFGYKSRVGAWDEFILGSTQLNQIKKFIENESNS